MNAPARINSALNVRGQFPAVGEWHYLDSAATAQKPQAVIDAIAQAYSRDYATVHRGVYERSATMTRRLRAARAAAASNLIGGQPRRTGVHPRGDGGDQSRRAAPAEERAQPRPPLAARASQQHRAVAARRLRNRRRSANSRRSDRPRRSRSNAHGRASPCGICPRVQRPGLGPRCAAGGGHRAFEGRAAAARRLPGGTPFGRRTL